MAVRRPASTTVKRTPARRAREQNVQATNLHHTRRQHARETAEDYAEAIADLVAERGEARVMDLAERLGVTHVTVNRTIARLQKAGLVTSQPYRAIFLTGQGKAVAETSKTRHRIVIAFLLSLGIPRRVAEIDAEGIEHHVSPETLAAFRAALGTWPQGMPVRSASKRRRGV